VLRKLFVCLLICPLTCARLWAGAGPDRKKIDKVKKKVAACLEHHRRVTIETYDDRLLQGFVNEAAADAFLLSYNSKSTSSTMETSRRLNGHRKHRSRSRLSSGQRPWSASFSDWLFY
jgi:hypothetical protein